MVNDPFCQAAINALKIKPASLADIEIDSTKSRNAAAAMTMFLAQRLRKVDPTIKKLKNTTYAWNGGLVNIRNAVKDEVWTNLRSKTADALHSHSVERPVLYLFNCWEPYNKTMHTWAIPEGVIYSALPSFPVETDPGKKTIRIKPGANKFESIENSPEVEGFHVIVELTEAELAKLKEAQKVDVTQRGSTTNEPKEDDSTEFLGNLDNTHLPSGDGDALSSEVRQLLSLVTRTKNILLYGPPGTGKTYTVQKFAAALQQQAAPALSPEQASLEVLKDTRWYDAIALAMYLSKKPTLKVAEILETPVMQLVAKIKTEKTVRISLWGQLQSHTHPDVQTVRVTNRMEPYLFSKRQDSSWELTPDGRQYIETELAEELAILTGKAKPQAESNNVRFVTFHQSFAYEEFIEGLKPLPPEKTNGTIQYDIQPGIFKQIATDARLAYEAAPDKSNAPKFLLIIDEINRANIAKVFGELITLIEDDKRLGQPNALSVTLPYSQQQFSVPPNLYLLGTLNTADRSIAQLDLALRRRFAFVEMLPDYSLFQGKFASTLAGIDLAKLLGALNDQISRLLDPDHQIGHAYLLFKTEDLPDEAAQRDALHFAFTHKILPLLQEYFHNDSPRLHRCLGNAFFTTTQIPDHDAEFSPHTHRHTLKHLSPDELPHALTEFITTHP